MQTFLPYPDLRASCVVLDDKRLGVAITSRNWNTVLKLRACSA